MQESKHKPTARVLNILETLASNPDGFTLTEIASSIESPKSTISPIIYTMTERGFLHLNKATGKYKIGISAFSVGSSYVSDMNALQFIQRQMEYVVRETGEICQLGIKDNNMVLYIAKVDSKEAIRLVSSVGKRLPLYCTALGKALIYQMDIDDIKKLYPNGLKAFTKNTITSFEALEKNLHEIQKTDIAFEHAEVTDHIHCLATPLVQNDKIVASVSVSVPIFRINKEKENLIISVLKEVRSTIETFFIEENVDVSTLTL